MINRNSQDLQARYYGDKPIMYVYHITIEGARLVWQAISSCFGAGYWINNYGWKNTDGWRNNK